MDHSPTRIWFFRRELVFALVFIVIGSLLEKAVDRTDLIYPVHVVNKNQAAVFVPRLNQTGGRKPPEQVIDQLRTAVEGSLVAVEDTLERVLFAYADRFLPGSAAREDEPTGPLVLRFFGPAGTGKTTMACLLATAAYSYEDATAKCIKSHANFESPFIVSRTFKKDGSAVKEMLNVIRDVNKKLEGRERHGIALVLNDYSMADRNVWAVMSSFIKQDNMKNSIVVLTDGLATEGSDASNIRLSPGTTTGEALDMIEDEVKGTYPGEYLDLSGNNTDIWIPFLPLPDEAIGRLIQGVCDGENSRLKRLIPDYHGEFPGRRLSNKKLTSWLGRLVCDAKSKAQASLKLSSCAQDQGANIIKAFEEAFGSVFRERKFCRLLETGEATDAASQTHESDLWTKCLSWKGLPMVSIAFEVNTGLQQNSESCSAADMREWIEFRLFNSLPGPSDDEFANGPMCFRTSNDQSGLVFSHAGQC